MREGRNQLRRSSSSRTPLDLVEPKPRRALLLFLDFDEVEKPQPGFCLGLPVLVKGQMHGEPQQVIAGLALARPGTS